MWPAVAGATLPSGAEADLVVRPEAVALARATGPLALAGTVSERRYAGRTAYFRVATEAGEIEVLGAPDAAREGDRVFVVPAAGGPAPRLFPREA